MDWSRRAWGSTAPWPQETPSFVYLSLFALSTLAPSFVINSVPSGKRKFWRFMKILLSIFPRGSRFGGWIFLTGEENRQFCTAKILVTIVVFLMRVTEKHSWIPKWIMPLFREIKFSDTEICIFICCFHFPMHELLLRWHDCLVLL